MKLAVVVQRYGANISGGAELHAQYITEQLSHHADVTVLTTCATDYISWRNELPATKEQVGRVLVRRFPVHHERNPESFARHSTRVFDRTHSINDELAWLDSEGPASHALIRYIRTNAEDFDFFIFFSYRYYHAFHGILAAAHRAVLVPTAERDAALGLNIFGQIFRNARAIMYNSFEEQILINAVSDNAHVPGVIVGVGSKVPHHTAPERFRRKFKIDHPFIIYVGRVDANKGCRQLFEYFIRYATNVSGKLSLVLIGNSVLPIPAHQRIHHLGFTSDRDKFDGMAAAELLVIPSQYESLSMATLEAWGLGRPVLANGHCDVLKGQCLRSNAGLYYDNYEEFAEALYALETSSPLRKGLGHNGRRFFSRHYTWPVINRKYFTMLEQLKKHDVANNGTHKLEKLPGWWTRRRRRLPPANDIIKALPTGPAPNARRSPRNSRRR